MHVIDWLRSGTGRIARIIVGFALIYFGATHASLLGLVLMMVGMVPAVTGVAGICLFDEPSTARGRPPGHVRPHEGRI
jgi:hypothetical protein